jgi:hypothetical protein
MLNTSLGQTCLIKEIEKMKKLICLPVLAVCFLNVHLFAYSTITTDELKRNLTGNNTLRASGTGIYVHAVCKKAINQEDLLKGKEFQNDQQKQEYLNQLRLTTDIDISFKRDKLTYTLEKLQFNQNKMRRDYADISDTMANNILNDANSIKDIPLLKILSFDGQKIVSLQNLPRPDGGTINYGIVENNHKMYFPEFYNFGRATGEDIKALPNFDGSAIIHQSVVDKQIHNDLEMGNGTIKLKWIFETDKGMSISYIGFYTNNQLKEEIICQDFTKTIGGEWYPQKYASYKYAHINGEKMLISAEMFDAIPGSVNFNISIDPSVFSPEFPNDTRVTDFRHNPPLSYTTELPK